MICKRDWEFDEIRLLIQNREDSDHHLCLNLTEFSDGIQFFFFCQCDIGLYNTALPFLFCFFVRYTSCLLGYSPPLNELTRTKKAKYIVKIICRNVFSTQFTTSVEDGPR
jgi:hypothetical protein